MKVTQEKLPNSQLGLEVEIPAETSKKTYEKVIRDLSRSVNIPGFRKGKAPRHILLQRLGPQRVKAAALEELVQDSLKAALDQEEIKAIGNYSLRSEFDTLLTQYQPGQPIIFSAAVDVAPVPELGQYQELSIQAEVVPSQVAEQVDEWFSEQQNRLATLVPIEDRPAQLGDTAVVDFEGREVLEGDEPGEILPGTEVEDFDMELVADRFIPGMVEGVVGMQAGETKDIAVTFPEDYPQESLASKAAVFTVTVHDIKEKELPELDDEFADEVSEFETLAELRTSLEDRFQKEAEAAQKKSIQDGIIKSLQDSCAVELPETLIDQEIDHLMRQMAMQMEQLGLSVKQLFTAETIPSMRENRREEAVTNLQSKYILEAIAKAESLTVTDEEYEQKLKEMEKQLEGIDVDAEKLKAFITEDLLREKTLTWLGEHNEVTLVPEGTLSKTDSTSEEEGEPTALPETESVRPETEDEALEDPDTTSTAAATVDVTATEVTETEEQVSETEEPAISVESEDKATPKAETTTASKTTKRASKTASTSTKSRSKAKAKTVQSDD